MKIDIEKEKIEKLINEGVTFKQIAKMFNVPLIRLRRFCKKYDLQSKYAELRSKETNCPNCGVSIITTIGEDKKFCCRSCSTTYNNLKKSRENPKEVKLCKQCNSVIKEGEFYCSIRCHHLFNNNIKLLSGVACSANVRKYLIKTHGSKCMECGWDKINPTSGKVPIELEHIDGNSENNQLDNVKLLCPNCHSLTPTYKGLNRGKGRHKRMERYRDGKSY
jgi:hypothetical protein